MKARNLKAVVILLLLIVFVAQAAGYIIGAQDSSVNTTTGLNQAIGYDIGNEISAVWGYVDNSSAGTTTWYAATLTGVGTASVTATFPLKVHPTEIVIQTSNGSQDAWNLLQANDVYTLFTLGSSGFHGNFSSITMYFGTAINDTGVTSPSDKGVQGYDSIITLYSNSVDHLGKNIQVSPVTLLDSFPTTTAQYIVNLQNNKSVNNSVAEVFTIGQQWSYTAHYPIVTEIFVSALFLDAILGYVLYAATPVQKGDENRRVMRFQSKKEARATYEGIGLMIVTFIVIGIMGTFSDLWGWGAAIAFLAGFGLATMVYTSDPVSHSYGRTILVGFIGGIVLVGVNLFVAFGTTEYNAIYGNSLVAAIQAVVYALLMLGAAYIGIVNTKKVHLVERE